MKLTEEQKQLLAEAISTYDEVCWWKYSSPEKTYEALSMGEKPPTRKLITEEMLLERIVLLVEEMNDESKK